MKLGGYLLIAGIVLLTAFFTFIGFKRNKKASNKRMSPGAVIDETSRILVDTAFNTLLERGTDYTVAGEVEGRILVKKVVKWAYYMNNGESLKALFTIETDKGIFAFQVDGEKIMRVPTDIVLSMYEFK